MKHVMNFTTGRKVQFISNIPYATTNAKRAVKPLCELLRFTSRDRGLTVGLELQQNPGAFVK